MSRPNRVRFAPTVQLVDSESGPGPATLPLPSPTAGSSSRRDSNATRLSQNLTRRASCALLGRGPLLAPWVPRSSDTDSSRSSSSSPPPTLSDTDSSSSASPRPRSPLPLTQGPPPPPHNPYIPLPPLNEPSQHLQNHHICVWDGVARRLQGVAHHYATEPPCSHMKFIDTDGIMRETFNAVPRVGSHVTVGDVLRCLERFVERIHKEDLHAAPEEVSEAMDHHLVLRRKDDIGPNTYSIVDLHGQYYFVGIEPLEAEGTWKFVFTN